MTEKNHIDKLVMTLYVSGYRHLKKEVFDHIGTHLQYCETCAKDFEREIKNRLERLEQTSDLNDDPMQSDRHITVSQIQYLRSIEQVLQVGEEIEPQWFRHGGPIAVDFQRGTVYCQDPKLSALKKLVVENPVSILIGDAGSGKTVLSRNLAYNMLCGGEKDIYYFNCAEHENFDYVAFAYEVSQINGMIILENIDACVPEFQQILSRIEKDLHGSILCTARPSFLQQQYSQGTDLGKIPSITIEPCDNFKGIINWYVTHFASKQDDLLKSHKILQHIEHISGNNLVLLTCLLKGWGESKDTNYTGNWLEKYVLEKLVNLERLHMQFPEALVAISPLYMSEVLTAETYLSRRLGFTNEILASLVKLGEITCRKTTTGDIFYGLPHLTLAQAYWTFGKKYRNRRYLPKYEDFVYDYILSGAPNALEAFVKIGNFLKKPYPSNMLVMKTDKFLERLTRQMQDESDVVDIASQIRDIYHIDSEMGQKLWKYLDVGRLASRLNHSMGVLSIVLCIDKMLATDAQSVAHETCRLLKSENLVQMLKRIDSVNRKGYLETLTQANEDVGNEIKRMLVKN